MWQPVYRGAQVDAARRRGRGQRRRCALELLEPRLALTPATPIISEFMAANARGLRDVDGEYSDWIELYNPSETAVNLAGWRLTDDDANLAKWAFPEVTLGAGQYLVVFASGKDRANPAAELHTNFQLNADGDYLALVEPDGTTIASQFSPVFPPQRTDVSYGTEQRLVETALVGAGSAAKLLVPTAADDAAIGRTWTGAAEPFADAGWAGGQLAVGYDDQTFVPPNPQPVALTSPTVTYAQPDYGIEETIDGITGGSDNGWAVYYQRTTQQAAVYRTTAPLTTPALEIRLVHNTSFSEHTIAEFRLSVTADPAPTATGGNNWVTISPASVTSTGGAIMADVGNQRIRATGPNPSVNTYVFRAAAPLAGITGIRLEVFPFDSNSDGTPTLGRDTTGAGNGNFVLSEFTVTALASLIDADPTNVAQGKAVAAAGPTYGGLPKEHLVDNNDDTFTHNQTPSRDFWYRVDLGKTYALDRIELTNRNDEANPERLTNYRVTVYADAGGSPGPVVWSADVRTDGSNCGVGGVDVLRGNADPDGSFDGRFVQAQAIDNGTDRYFQIAELRVFDAGAGANYDPLIRTDLEAAMRGTNPSVYARSAFDVADPGAFDQVALRMKYDDGFVAYLNGTEIARRNAPAGTPSYQAAATAGHYASAFEEFAVPKPLLLAGRNVLAIQGLNATADDAKFLLFPELAGITLNPAALAYFLTPTPGQLNQGGVVGFVADTKFSQNRGYYSSPFDTVITSSTPGAAIAYTTDGTLPSPTHGTRVEAPDANTPPTATVHVATTTTLRAVAFKAAMQPSNVDTQTYLFLADVIRQPSSPAGLPASWNGYPADYAMDQRVVTDPAYASEIIADMRSIPTLSIVLDPDDLFGPTNGIYTFPDNRGVQWERPASVEMILPDGSTAFQVDAGVGIWGYGWRPHSSTLKHALRLFFNSEFGETKLDYPMFADTPVHEFDTLILRAQGSRGWTDFRTSITGTQYIHDTWTRDTARDMGKFDGHATYVQLYLNGLYWGLYNPVERPDANFGASYLGGTDADYDALSHRVGLPIDVLDGDLVAWNQMQALADAGLSTPVQYAAIQQYLDVDDLIDYMLVQQYSTNADGPDNGSNNMRLIRKREPGAEFYAFFWDMEYSFWEASDNRNINVDVPDSISHVYAKLRDNAEFRLLYADHVQKHLFNSGALTPAAAAARWQARANEIYGAVVGESARWGDFRRPSQPYTRNVEWQAELNRLLTQYFPQRTGYLLGQLRTAGLYPSIDAPAFKINGAAQHGGAIPAGASLTITTPSGSIYYTLDGSDPRVPGGAIRGTLYTGPRALSESTLVKARSLQGGVWSALLEAEFIVGGVPGAIRPVLAELNYHPYPPTAAEDSQGFTDRDDFEFIELVNTSASRTLDLRGVKLIAGVTFDFGASAVASLGPGERVLVVRNQPAFEARYGTGLRVAGQYTGSLDNAGERIALADANDVIFADFTYGDSGAWPGRADGPGSSLEIVTLGSDYSNPDNWRSSSEYGGSPGSAGIGPLVDVVINEVRARSDAPAVDAIELYNATAAPIDLGGWRLSDSSDELLKFRIPDGTTIDAHGYLVFREGHWAGGTMEFAPSEFGGGPTGFSLDSARGGHVWLVETDASGRPLRFADHVEFGASASGESFGRWPDGSGRLAPLLRPTLDAPNNANPSDGNGPRVGPLLLSEVMYAPAALTTSERNAGFTTQEDLEFVEVFNPSGAPVDLTRWQLDNGVTYAFAAGTSLAPGKALVVVPFDPADTTMLAAFRGRYGMASSLPVVGPYSGHLSNSGEEVRLLRPDAPLGEPAYYPLLLEDNLTYTPAWGGALGDGKSLHRLAVGAWGENQASWGAAPGSPGSVALVAGRYVFYNNSLFDGGDPAANNLDDAAIAVDKRPLLPGQWASFANYTSYRRALNGIMVDLTRPSGTVVAGDFGFRVSTGAKPLSWTTAVTPAVSTRTVSGLTRVTLVWPDNAIQNRWLEVTVRGGAGTHTGLSASHVFYFGNAMGEAGDHSTGAGADAVVDALDELAVRSHYAAPAPVSNPYDFNRDGAVDAADEAIAAANHSGATPLVLIGVPDVLRILPNDWTDVGLTLQAGGDGRLHVYRTGSATDAVASRARAVTTSIQIVGRDGAADALTLDLSNGNPVPVGGAVYDGAAGDNSLVIADAANQDMLGMTAGQLTLNGSPLITYSHVSSFSFDLGAGTLDLGGGDLVLGCLTLVSGSIDSGSLAAGAVVVHGGTVWAAMTGAGSLIKTTAGTLLLTNANSYTGGTRVDGGTLVVGHPLGIPHGGLTIGPGATVVLSFDLGQAGVGRIANPSYETAGARNGLSRWSNNVADSPSVTSNSPDPAGVAFAAPVVVVSAPAPVQRESPVVAAAIAGSRSMPKGCPASLCAAVPVLSVPIEVKAHDLVLQAPIHQTGDDLAWVEAVHGAWTRKRSAKKHAGALSAVDQVLASLPG